MGTCVVVGSIGQTVFGNRRIVFATISCSASYATGGDTLNASQLGLVHMTQVNTLGPAPSTAAEQDSYSLSPNVVTTGASANQTALVQAFGDGGNAPGGPLIEATATTNLTNYQTLIMAIGY